jgi:hypothetical protein
VISRASIPWALIIKSLFGIRIIRRPRMTASGQETFEHPGYSFKTTRDELTQFMHVDAEFNDPIRNASFNFGNSHIFVARLK